MFDSVIDQLFIDLVCHDEEVVLHRKICKTAQALFTVHRTRGVVGGADDDALGAGSDGTLNGIQIQLVVVFPDGNENGSGACQLDHLGVADPARNGE